jgi:hypothetical protein
MDIVRARYDGPLSPEQRRRIAHRVSKDSRVMEAQKAVNCVSSAMLLKSADASGDAITEQEASAHTLIRSETR